MSREPLRPRASYALFTPVTTRWHDNDAYGHVNNAVYYQWFDTAVNEWLVANGLLDIEHGNPIGLVVETGCRYAASIAFPQTVEVGLRIATIGRSSVTYHLGVFAKGSTDPAAEGQFTHVYVDRTTRRPVAIPDSWRLAMERIA